MSICRRIILHQASLTLSACSAPREHLPSPQDLSFAPPALMAPPHPLAALPAPSSPQSPLCKALTPALPSRFQKLWMLTFETRGLATSFLVARWVRFSSIMHRCPRCMLSTQPVTCPHACSTDTTLRPSVRFVLGQSHVDCRFSFLHPLPVGLSINTRRRRCSKLWLVAHLI